MAMIKVVYCITKKAELTDEEFFHYWKTVHGPLGARIPRLRKLVQSHRLTIAVDELRPDYDGIAELWFDSLDDLRRAISDPCYLSEIHPDELKFLDFPNCVILLVEEVAMG